MLKIENLSFEYASRTVLSDVSFELSSGMIAALIGPNGSGKTTLLRCIARFLKPNGGKIVVDGTPLNAFSANNLARTIAYMPQRCAANGLTVFDALLLGRRPYMSWRPSARDLELVEETLNELNLRDKALRTLDKLSGGELQKVSLGRVFVQESKLLILDEPTSALDLKNRTEISELLRQYVRRVGATVLTSAHDLNDAFRIADRLLFLKNGRLIANSTPETATPETLSELYELPLEIISRFGAKIVTPITSITTKENEKWKLNLNAG